LNLEDARRILKPKAEKALAKPAPHGLDLSLSGFKLETGFGTGVEGSEKILESVGIDLRERNRSGSYYQVDNRAVYASARQGGLTVKPLARGFTEEEAKSIIVRGFLQVELSGLPENLVKYLEGILASLAASL